MLCVCVCRGEVSSDSDKEEEEEEEELSYPHTVAPGSLKEETGLLLWLHSMFKHWHGVRN